MGMIVNLYRSGGVTATTRAKLNGHDRVVCVNIDGPFDPSEDMPPVLLEDRSRRGPGEAPSFVYVPATPCIGGWRAVRSSDYDDGDTGAGPMMSGTYAASSDSRVTRATGGYYCAWPVHDYFDRKA